MERYSDLPKVTSWKQQSQVPAQEPSASCTSFKDAVKGPPPSGGLLFP